MRLGALRVDQRGNLVGHRVELLAQVTKLVLRLNLNPDTEVACSKEGGAFIDGVYRAPDRRVDGGKKRADDDEEAHQHKDVSNHCAPHVRQARFDHGH